MKAVLVGVIEGEKKLYYVIDSDSPEKDGIIDYDGKPKIVNFWKTVRWSKDIEPIKSTKFHTFLWDGAAGETLQSWTRIFINKSQSIDKSMLEGVTIKLDVMRAKNKVKSLDQRANDFKTSSFTQNFSLIRRKYSE